MIQTEQCWCIHTHTIHTLYVCRLGTYMLNKFKVTLVKSSASRPVLFFPRSISSFLFLPVRGITVESSQTTSQCKSRPPAARAVIYCLKIQMQHLIYMMFSQSESLPRGGLRGMCAGLFTLRKMCRKYFGYSLCFLPPGGRRPVPELPKTSGEHRRGSLLEEAQLKSDTKPHDS